MLFVKFVFFLFVHKKIVFLIRTFVIRLYLIMLCLHLLFERCECLQLIRCVRPCFQSAYDDSIDIVFRPCLLDSLVTPTDYLTFQMKQKTVTTLNYYTPRLVDPFACLSILLIVSQIVTVQIGFFNYLSNTKSGLRATLFEHPQTIT